jgi:predicted RNA-binding Zn ribbon-like protein
LLRPPQKVSRTGSRFSLGGRLAVDFANVPATPGQPIQKSLSWEELLAFLEASRIIAAERRAQLLTLPQSDAQSADALLVRALRLRDRLRQIFGALARKERLESEWVEAINGVLRITEGHDELVLDAGAWKLGFMAREGGLDWLLAAIARSAAEILDEGKDARLRACGNPHCSFFFYDQSRTHKRRWCSMALCGNRHKVAAFARRHLVRNRAGA